LRSVVTSLLCHNPPKTVMKSLVLLCVLVAVAAFLACGDAAATSADANKYLDNILLVANRNNKVLQGVSVPDFEFKVKSGTITTADIQGKFTKGKLTGFTQIKRQGDCTAPKSDAGFVTISCKMDLSGLKSKYDASIKGFNVIGTEKTVDYTLTVKNTVAMVEVAQATGKPPTVKTFFIDVINTDAEVADVGFNADRKKQFKTEVDKKASPAMFDVLYKTYADGLRDAVKQAELPKP